MSDSMPKQYDPNQHESKIYQKWEDAAAFQPNLDAIKAGRQPFTIMLPPPNITGSLHMGHALEDTIIDILVRYHRLLGDCALWVPGTDSAAIATNRVIEKQLAEQGKNRHDIGRDEFQKLVDAWYEKTGQDIINQMKRLGCSCDWSRQRFTMDDQYIKAVNAAFIEYHQKGYIYRGARLVNWDPKTQTTVSDLEIAWQTERTSFYTFKYGPFEIGTARPETKFGDKYVVMHPDDSRYSKYKNSQQIQLEWINGPITATIIKDDAVDPDFGTGVMTITPWHDSVDFDLAQRHNLDMQQIIDFTGQLLPIAGEFAGQSITEARPKVVEKLKGKGLLVSVDENYEHNIALNDRGQGVIEPQVMRQWFVDMSKLKNQAIKAAEREDVKFIPDRWKKHFINWLQNVHDWNINRQIWLGHRLPVWWKPGTHGTDSEDGNFQVSIKKPAGDWVQDPDVLDTWFATALWPFAALGWPDQTKDLENFYPTSVLTSARDILYLWDARMVFSGLELMRDVPFKDVLIHPTVMSKNGQRMSKSLGTGVDPLDLIEKYGADATRFGLMYQLNYDQQAIKFDEQAIKAARNFANKIWNLARFIDQLPSPQARGGDGGGVKSVADQWIQHRLSQVTQEIINDLNAYHIGEAARSLHSFVWDDFADWYIEILKTEGSPAVARQVFTDILKLLHPFMPFVTEVIWQHMNQDGMLINASFPSLMKEGWIARRDGVVELTHFQDLVRTIRSARALLNINPGTEITIYLGEDVSLAASLQALTKSQISSSEPQDSLVFTLQSGQQIRLASAEITPASINQARAKLTQEKDHLATSVIQQEKVIKQMAGKAPAEKIAAKQAQVKIQRKRLEEIDKSLHLLA